MACISLDLTIDGALVDPIIGAAMRADRVDPKTFETMLRSTARRLEVDAPRALPGAALACRVLATVGIGTRPW